MKNVVPFRAPDTFERLGIDWTKEPTTELERLLREAFLGYESCCGTDGFISLVLLALVSQRQGDVATDLQAAADFAEIMLAMKARRHQDDALSAIHAYFTESGSTDLTDVALLLDSAPAKRRPRGRRNRSLQPMPGPSLDGW